jgi:hypothetical protein
MTIDGVSEPVTGAGGTPAEGTPRVIAFALPRFHPAYVGRGPRVLAGDGPGLSIAHLTAGRTVTPIR